jgi:protoporphyrinogen oxidase
MATPHNPETAPDAAPAHRADAPVVVIGGGPAGLTAAYRLAQTGDPVVVVEQDKVLGGISRTVERDGWRFDIGGHRFFTKVVPVEEFWHEILPDEDFLLRPRMSRIFYGGKYYDYPIKLGNALSNLGIVEAVRCGLSFLWVRVRPPKDLSTLEGYIVSNYGWRLYHHFFKTYNEKVWGVSASELSADWGAQRIKGMSLWNAVWEPIRASLGSRRHKSKQVTSLIEEFQYPKYGPGMMWERCCRRGPR